MSGMHLRDFYAQQLENSKRAADESRGAAGKDADDFAEGSGPSAKMLWGVLVVAGIIAGSTYLYLKAGPDPTTTATAQSFQRSFAHLANQPLTSASETLLSDVLPPASSLPPASLSTEQMTTTTAVPAVHGNTETKTPPPSVPSESLEVAQESKRSSQREGPAVNANVGELFETQQRCFALYSMILQRDQLIIKLQQEIRRRDALERERQIQEQTQTQAQAQTTDREEKERAQSPEDDDHDDRVRTEYKERSPKSKKASQDDEDEDHEPKKPSKSKKDADDEDYDSYDDEEEDTGPKKPSKVKFQPKHDDEDEDEKQKEEESVQSSPTLEPQDQAEQMQTMVQPMLQAQAQQQMMPTMEAMQAILQQQQQQQAFQFAQAQAQTHAHQMTETSTPSFGFNFQ